MKFLLLLLILMVAPTALAQDLTSVQPVGRTELEGTLVQVSQLPVAERSPYPDCYYTCTININQILSGRSIPAKVILVLPGFFSRQYAPEAKFKPGDKIRATVVPFASMPEKVKQIQQADETEDVTMEIYFPEKINLIQDFKNSGSPIPFAGAIANSAAPTVQPLDLQAKTARKEQMLRDLEEINLLLLQHGGDWDEWYDSLKDFRAQYHKEFTSKTQRWVGDSFFSAGALGEGKIYNPEFIKSVVAFKNYLSARNVDLILVRVPMKGEIVDDMFANTPKDGISNPHLLRLYKELLEADVEIITDVIPAAKERRLKYPLMYWYQDFEELHPAEGIAWVIAEEFAKRITRYDRIRATAKTNLLLGKAQGDYSWPQGNNKYNTAEHVSFSSIAYNGPLSLRRGTESPVLILGSSFIVTPSLEKGGSIPQYFAYLTGIVPDIFQRNEGDIMMPRSVIREGEDFLRKRRVCLFPFVPWLPYTPFVSVPMFDPDHSAKTLLTSYHGPALVKAIEFPPDTAKELVSFSSRGLLSIWPTNKKRDLPVHFKVTLPDSLAEYPYFVVTIAFGDADRTSVTVRYSDQTDLVKRSEMQSNNDEVFAFVSGADRSVTVNLIANRYYETPAQIKSIKIFGVTEPKYYNAKNTGP